MTGMVGFLQMTDDYARLVAAMVAAGGWYMHPTVTFRGMTSSPTIETYINERIKKIDRILDKEPSPKNLEVILEANPVHHHHAVELRLHSAHYHLRAQAEGPDLYERIDHVFDVLLNEIRKQKDKWLSQRNHPHISDKTGE